MSEEKILKANFDLGFTYTRTTGPVIGHFLTQLQKCKLVGIKGANNKVIFPPAEYDPTTGESLSEFIEVSEIGIVMTWVWVKKPLNKHPLKEPFAWALIRLGGADTNFLHVVKAKTEESMKTNMKVKACWALPPRGTIADIKYFEPLE